MMKQFVYNCDEVGIAVPNDSIEFREKNLSDDKFEEYRQNPSLWPNNELIEAMVMARLHALPTRFLDWTTDPYVAIYFAVSQALNSQKLWRRGQKIAVFSLRVKEKSNEYLGPVRVLRVRGAISKNLAAQKGLFTVHPVLEGVGEPVSSKSLEEYLPSETLLLKYTVPVEECAELYYLCGQFNYNAARLYPDINGASMSVLENLSYLRAKNQS